MAMPQLVASKWASVPLYQRALQPSRTKTASSLAAQIDALRSRQNGEGGFGVWAATPDADPFISAYAMHFLLEARDRGVDVPREAIDSGNRYLQQLAADDSQDSLDGLRQRAYAVYLLTREGNVTTNNLAAVQKRLQDAYPKVWRDDLAAGWLAASYKLLKQDRQAGDLIERLQGRLERNGEEAYTYSYYYDPPTRDVTVLYLLARHFPERAKGLSPRVLENIARPLEMNEFNTLSAAMTLLALDTYASGNAAAIDKLKIDEMHANGTSKTISTQQSVLQAGDWSGMATRLRFTNGSPLAAWYMVDQAGYDRDIPANAIKNGLEIVRDYTDRNGNALNRITLGEEIDVHVKIRATGNKGVGNVVIVDLLPGGFETVAEPSQSFAQSGSTWKTTYTDVREDRVVIYGTATPDVTEFVYRIKPDAAGTFVVPPAYGESMYDRRVQARAPGGGMLTVVRAP
jgi:hypothetical protein